jgi:hypothetical protein
MTLPSPLQGGLGSDRPPFTWDGLIECIFAFHVAVGLD